MDLRTDDIGKIATMLRYTGYITGTDPGIDIGIIIKKLFQDDMGMEIEVFHMRNFN
jgi:hypothetical protein